MAKPTHKPHKITPECPKCKETCAVIWLKDGTPIRARAEKVRVIFCNQANAGGSFMDCYVEHQCKKGK